MATRVDAEQRVAWFRAAIAAGLAGHVQHPGRDARPRVNRHGAASPGPERPARVVNAGSVGMPFGEPGAYWLVLGPDVQPRRTDYDLAVAAERIRATDYPHAGEFASSNVLRPPSEREMLALFAPAELK